MNSTNADVQLPPDCLELILKKRDLTYKEAVKLSAMSNTWHETIQNIASNYLYKMEKYLNYIHGSNWSTRFSDVIESDSILQKTYKVAQIVFGENNSRPITDHFFKQCQLYRHERFDALYKECLLSPNLRRFSIEPFLKHAQDPAIINDPSEHSEIINEFFETFKTSRERSDSKFVREIICTAIEHKDWEDILRFINRDYINTILKKTFPLEIIRGHVKREIIKKLFEKFDSKSQEKFICKLIQNNCWEILLPLLETTFDINSILEKAIPFAINRGHIGMIMLLLKNKDHFKAEFLNKAVEIGHLPLTKTLLATGADPNSLHLNFTPLLHAVKNNEITFIKLLIAEVADPNIGDNFDNTPLHHAAYYNFSEALHVLLASGADPKKKNNDNLFPLDIAEKKGSQETAATLLPLTYQSLCSLI